MDDIETDETEILIASNKVEGTSVYNTDGEKLGSIYNFMVDKESGQVEYAVLQFGGFLGIGSDYYPVPWMALEYDEEQGGYVIDVDKEFLESAPRYSGKDQPRFTPAYGGSIDEAYGIEYGAGMIMANIDDEVADDFEDDTEVEEAPPRTHHFENFVRDNPVGAVAGALVIGIILGRIGIL